MNEISTKLIVALCEELRIPVTPDDETFIENYDYSVFPYAIKDESDYHVVDFEEADYGVVRYYSDEKKIHLLATWVNHGGDSTEWEFTKTGVSMMIFFIENILRERINKYIAVLK